MRNNSKCKNCGHLVIRYPTIYDVIERKNTNYEWGHAEFDDDEEGGMRCEVKGCKCDDPEPTFSPPSEASSKEASSRT